MRIRLAAILLLVTTPVLAEGSSAGYGGGGWYEQFHPIVEQYNHSGELFRIVGNCQSACTMFLGIRNVCIEPGATLRFHAGKDKLGNMSAVATGRMLATYNGRLRAFLAANHAMEKFAFTAVSGTDMVRNFGYRACPRR
jgi:hypothetical protein